MKLAIPVLINCLLVIGVYLADKYTAFKKLSYMKKQIVIGVLFGGLSSFASSYGVEWLGAIVNVRDAAPLSAGLIFGAPAGIISGLIGGLCASKTNALPTATSAALAAYLHGKAGEAAEQKVGARAAMARDILDALKK